MRSTKKEMYLTLLVLVTFLYASAFAGLILSNCWSPLCTSF